MPKTGYKSQAKAKNAGEAPSKRAEARQEAKRRRRKDRTLINDSRMRLQVDSRPGYVRRWVNDDGNRLRNLYEMDWDFVRDPNQSLQVGQDQVKGEFANDLGTGVRRQVSKDKWTGEPTYAYLMEKKQDWYEEDQEEKRALHNEKLRRLEQGQDEANSSSRYIPGENKIKLT